MNNIKCICFFIFYFLLGVIPLLRAQSVRVEYLEESKREFKPGTSQAAMDFMRFTQTVLTTDAELSWYEALGEKSFIETLDVKTIKPELLQQLSLKDMEQANVRSSKIWTKNRANEYKSLIANQTTSYMYIGHQKFHIESPIYTYDWKITADTATIAGMRCRKAQTTSKNGIAVEAWFTDDIPIANGPDMYHGLPGLILRVETPQRIISAQKITFIDAFDIKKPEDSELIPQEKLMKKLMQASEMERNSRGKPVKPGN
jgi:GLPGLI family protein